ncbi:MAG TPA: TIGR02680 family protein [Eubacteriaceae bacterium]|nr:TIGR02680 family protein [Eubacteriaceae bacterium]
MEQWTINRAGVINFWYYDDEVFHFEDGRLLLRGANGSGKSVTMQSLIPLLFDGNKSPERLDPFGSKARKMESYLLSDGLDAEERTGYLYLEFEKPQSKRYITIGMGMRARKNMPMQTWYFLLLDNRRIGQNHELSLYKDVGEKIPLTQRELENRIGQGGHVYHRQGDYKEAVNNHLFGYEDMTDFDELIALLIQIRSPKLSKEFKPTTIYEIMQNSLVPLSDEDLRPMSEAIENMDEIKTKIDHLNATRKSFQRIQYAYDRYNQYMLAVKSKRLTDHTKEADEISSSLSKLEGMQNECIQKMEQLEVQIANNREEEKKMKVRLESLESHDLTKIAQEAEDLKIQIGEQGKNQNNKEEKLEIQRQREVELNAEIKIKDDQCAKFETEIHQLIEEMSLHAEDTLFDEHDFFIDEYRKSEAGYDFTYHKKQVKEYREKIKQGRQILTILDRREKEYDEAVQRLEQSIREREKQTREVRQTEEQLAQIKEEFAQKSFAWLQANQELIVPRERLQTVTERIYGYPENFSFEKAIAPLKEQVENQRQQILVERNKEQSQQELNEEELKVRQKEYETLKKQDEPEPKRSKAVIRNRQRLEEEKIPFVPFYKAVDFEKDVAENLRGIFEEAFSEMGILDALIVEPKHRQKVLKMDEGMADKYIFSDPSILSHNLKTYLKSDEALEESIDASAVQDALMSVVLNETNQQWYINEEGFFGVGLIQGKVSRQEPSRFVGSASRKRYKEEQLEEIQVQIKALQEREEQIRERIRKIDQRLQSIEREWQSFPSEEDLFAAYESYLSEKRKEIFLEEVEKDYRERSEDIYKQLKDIRHEAVEKTKRIYLKKEPEVFEQAEEDLNNYFGLLQETEKADRAKELTIQNRKILQENLEENFEQADQIRYDLQVIERAISRYKNRLYDIEDQLNMADFETVRKEIVFCHERLTQLPDEYRQLVQGYSQSESLKERNSEKIQEMKKEQIDVEAMCDLYAKALLKEMELGYAVVEGQEEKIIEENDLIPVARKIGSQYGAILQEKKTVMELQNGLNERFMKELGELSEYNLKGIYRFAELCSENTAEDDRMHIVRLDIVGRIGGKTLNFYELNEWIKHRIEEQNALLSEQDRALFEEILINSISRKISAKIYHSEQWVKKIDELMNSMDTSSGLSFHLKWVTKPAESEEQLSTKELVDILKGDQSLMTRDQKDRLIDHFQSKIGMSKIRFEEETDTRSFLAIMKEILDYRKWFDFQLLYTKKGERKKELTNNAFYTFSGGEKAMAMYVPLFSAVYAKYGGGRSDCPKVISLDEAFAGVDEKNIKDMFRLLVHELDLSFIANSQVLFGDYESVPALSIYELIRPENATYVTLIRYRWNGSIRTLWTEKEE